MRNYATLFTAVPGWVRIFRALIPTVRTPDRPFRVGLWVLLTGWMLPGLVAADYYVSPTGSDASPGTSAASPWKSLAKVNASAFKAGDRILLEGGQTFSTAQSGALVIRDVQATATNPLTLSSYGTGKAKIQVPATAKTGIVITACRNMRISNLMVTGPGRTVVDTTIAAKGSGISLTWVNDSSIDQVEISGFQRNGLYLNGCHRLLVTGVYAHDNGFAGIYSEGDGIFTANNCSELTIRGCRAINNPGDPEEYGLHSGNGILLTNTVDSTIEYCEAANNGWDMHWTQGGPVGIWVASSSRITIQNCISHDNKSSGIYDGCGFDLDSNTTNSILQYNYSYNNFGAGYLLYTNPGDRNSGNTVRYNISENDGNGCHKAGIYLGGQSDQSHTNTEIYNNCIINSAGRNAIGANGDFLPSTVRIRNNMLVLRGTGRFLTGTGRAVFQGNLYWNYDGGGLWSTYTSLDLWRKATGNERLADGTLVGVHADPLLVGRGSGGTPTDPYLLPTLKAYRFEAGSPCLNRGLNLRSVAGLTVGMTDLFGNDLALVERFDIGPYEFPRPSGLSLSPTTGPTTGGTVVTISGSDLVGDISVAFGDTVAAIRSVTGTEVVCVAPASGPGTVPVSVTNAGGTAIAGQFTAFIPAPVITSPTSATGQVEVTFAYQITATQGPTGFQAQGLPPGLEVNALTGLISGRPQASGPYSITIVAGNAGGSGSAILVLAIAPSTRSKINDFVTRLYQRSLGREPDASGLSSWTAGLVAGTRAANEVVRGLFLSPEFAGRSLSDGAFLDILYQALFNRAADAGGKTAWLGELKRGVLREDVLDGFILAPEFADQCAAFGITAIDATGLRRNLVRGFVRRFYQQCLGREPDPSGIATWVDGVLGGTLTGRDVARGFVGSPEFVQRRVSNDAFLEILYQAFFNRRPDSGGMSAWSAALTKGVSRDTVLDGFVAAQEFVQLCAAYGIIAAPASG